MKRRGFSLVELSIVILIFVLLLYCIFNLLSASSKQFTHQEEAISCTSEASNLIACLRRDFGMCVAPDVEATVRQTLEKAVAFQSGLLEFAMVDSGSTRQVSYLFDPQTKSVKRSYQGNAITFGKSFVGSFSVWLQMLGDDGSILSVPPDPELGSLSAAVFPPERQVVRGWVKVALTMEGNKPPKVLQEYVFRLFPLRLNRQIQSIWYHRKN